MFESQTGVCWCVVGRQEAIFVFELLPQLKYLHKSPRHARVLTNHYQIVDSWPEGPLREIKFHLPSENLIGCRNNWKISQVKTGHTEKQIKPQVSHAPIRGAKKRIWINSHVRNVNKSGTTWLIWKWIFIGAQPYTSLTRFHATIKQNL